LGGNSDLEIKEKRDRVEDSILAAQSALEEGIVPGGGLALLSCRKGELLIDEKRVDYHKGYQ